MIIKEQLLNKVPDIIQTRISELNELIEKHPYKIPTSKAAKFLGMDVECLKRAIEQGRVPFALGCSNDVYSNRYTYISSLTFYLWCISPVISQTNI